MASKKYMTVSEAAAAKDKASQFMRNLGKDDEADEFDSMTPEEYADDKGAEIVNQNPRRTNSNMATGKSKLELEQELDDAQDYIDELETRLDQIMGVASDDDDDSGSEDDEDGDDDDDDIDGYAVGE